jgi:hypothetical protein
MVTLDDLRQFLLSLPDVSEGMSWDSVSFKVNKKVILFWNAKYDAPVFSFAQEENEFLLEEDSDTFFTTDHHRKFNCLLGRPEVIDLSWVKAKLYEKWRRLVSKKTLKHFDLENPNYMA